MSCSISDGLNPSNSSNRDSSSVPYPPPPSPPSPPPPPPYEDGDHKNVVDSQSSQSIVIGKPAQSMVDGKTVDSWKNRLQILCDEYEIGSFFASKLALLRNYKIAIIADDSSSMNLAAHPEDPKSLSRWGELYQTVTRVTDFASVCCSNPIDLYFLNRPGVRAVQDWKVLSSVFHHPPRGMTPICDTLERVMSDHAKTPNLLIFIVTDGVPNSPEGFCEKKRFQEQLMNRDATRLRVSILACTDDTDTMDYLQELDEEMPCLDVVDDYVAERKNVQAARGVGFSFSRGDYIVKSLLGSIDKEIDALDEPSSSKQKHIQVASNYPQTLVQTPHFHHHHTQLNQSPQRLPAAQPPPSGQPVTSDLPNSCCSLQ